MLHDLCSQNVYAPNTLLPLLPLDMYTYNAHHETSVPKNENTTEMPSLQERKKEKESKKRS
jgi:hypothetical protein